MERWQGGQPPPSIVSLSSTPLIQDRTPLPHPPPPTARLCVRASRVSPLAQRVDTPPRDAAHSVRRPAAGDAPGCWVVRIATPCMWPHAALTREGADCSLSLSLLSLSFSFPLPSYLCPVLFSFSSFFQLLVFSLSFYSIFFLFFC